MRLDDILVRQKEGVIALSNDGKFLEALYQLQGFHELWCESGYAYKMNELLNRIYDDERSVGDDMSKIDRMCLDMMVSDPIVLGNLSKRPIV